MIRKTFGMTQHQFMWRETWPNLMMMLRDMPYYHYKSQKDKPRPGSVAEKFDTTGAKQGDIETLRKKFGKYIAHE
jgi:hypothetical protein